MVGDSAGQSPDGFHLLQFDQALLGAAAPGDVLQHPHAAAGPVGYIMALSGHERVSAKVFGASAALNLVLNAIGIPVLGMEGAAIATAVTMAFWNVWLILEVRRRLGISLVEHLLPRRRRTG